MRALTSANPAPFQVVKTMVFLAVALSLAGALVVGVRVLRRLLAAATALERESAIAGGQTRQEAHALRDTAQHAMARTRTPGGLKLT